MSTIKISELATSNIALTDFFAKADATGVASKNTVQELSNLLKTVDDTAFKGSIAIADVPSENGWYFASESGTYTNCGGLVIDTADNIAIIIVSGTFDTFNKIDIPVNITIDAIPTDGSNNAVSSNGVFDALALKVDTDMLSFTPLINSNSRMRSSGAIPGWKYDGVFGANTSFNVIDNIQGGISYQFEGCSNLWDANNRLFFLNGDGQAILSILDGRSGTLPFTTPIDCRKIVFGMQTNSFTSDLKLVQLTPQSEGYVIETKKSNGVNLTDGSYYINTIALDETGITGLIGLASSGSSAFSNVFDIKEGENYYAYGNEGLGGELYLMDENNVGLSIINPIFITTGTVDAYEQYLIPTGIGAVKAMLRLATSISTVSDVVSGSRKWIVVEEENKNIIQNIIEGTNKEFGASQVNEIVDSRQRFDKSFTDKSLMIIGDSVYATQNDAIEAYSSGATDVKTFVNLTNNAMWGGACSDIVRRLRPNFWTNYSEGGWTLTYTGSNFGKAIYDNNDTGTYLFNLEKFFIDYDNYISDPATYPKRVAPDVFMVASCINDFSNPTDAWATDADIATSGLSYDNYMEQTFISSGVNSDTLLPLDSIDLNKIGGALRYIIERVYRKFPKCFIAVVTPNKTTVHKRASQYKCVRDMNWITNRLNVLNIDLFNGGSQLNMLKEFKDSTTGTRDELFLTVDGIHDYGSVGKGYQRHGRFICNELINGFYPLDDFNV